jgi:hypothetical protein
LDVHRDFCEVAIAEGGAIRSAGRIPTRIASLEVFADSLLPSDVVALEATSGAEKIVSVLQTRGVRVTRREHAPAEIDHAGQGQDRSAGRAHADQAAGFGPAGRGVDAR